MVRGGWDQKEDKNEYTRILEQTGFLKSLCLLSEICTWIKRDLWTVCQHGSGSCLAVAGCDAVSKLPVRND